MRQCALRCLQKCDGCKYASYSTRSNDCSLYSSCDINRLGQHADYWTAHVEGMLATLPSSAFGSAGGEAIATLARKAVLSPANKSRTEVTLTTPTGGSGVVSTTLAARTKLGRNQTTVAMHNMRTHKIDFTDFHGRPAVRKQFIGNSWHVSPKAALNKSEAYLLEITVLERLGATMLAEKHVSVHQPNEMCDRRHFPILLRRDDTALRFETTMDGYPLSTPLGCHLFCAMPLLEVKQQERCMAAGMNRVNVQHCDFNRRNLLIQEGRKNTSRITIYDFDLTTIDGWDGRQYPYRGRQYPSTVPPFPGASATPPSVHTALAHAACSSPVQHLQSHR